MADEWTGDAGQTGPDTTSWWDIPLATPRHLITIFAAWVVLDMVAMTVARVWVAFVSQMGVPSFGDLFAQVIHG